jgi:CDP-diacylglycerol--serine O-phosphatidyltransferase
MLESSLTSYIPSTITLTALGLGVTSILLAPEYSESPLLACFILLAALLDLCDGMVARLLGQTSEFGKALDSLSDLVSFGVAPAAMVAAMLHAHDWPFYLNMAGIFYVLCAAIRLACFHDQDDETAFYGVPSPAAALLVVSAMQLSLLMALAALIFAAILMCLPHNFPSLKAPPAVRHGWPVYLALPLGVLAAIFLSFWYGLFIILTGYILIPFLRAYGLRND